MEQQHTPPLNASELSAITDTLENDWRRDEVADTSTFGLFGVTPGSPKDIFTKIAENYTKTINVTVLLPNGNPAVGVTVAGMADNEGQPCVTNEQGKTTGFSVVPTTLSITSPWIDIQDYSEEITNAEITINKIINLQFESSLTFTYTSSTNVRMSNNVTSIDYDLIGGGGAGGWAHDQDESEQWAQGGDCGAYQAGTQQLSTTSDFGLSIVVGSGGKGHTDSGRNTTVNGGSGGSTSITITGDSSGQKKFSAAGGKGGTANIYRNPGRNGHGGGGQTQEDVNGTNLQAGELVLSGGGGAYIHSHDYLTGTSTNGGNGASMYREDSIAGNAKNYGSGGGGAVQFYSTVAVVTSGSGYGGRVVLTLHTN